MLCGNCGVFLGFLLGNVLTVCEQRTSNECQACGRSGASRPRADNSHAVVNHVGCHCLTTKSFTLSGSRSLVRLRRRRFGGRLLLGSGRSRAASRCSASLRLRAPHLPAALRASGRPSAPAPPWRALPPLLPPVGTASWGATPPSRPPLLGRAPLRARSLATGPGYVCRGSVWRPCRSRAMRPRVTLRGRGHRPPAASSRPRPPRGKKMYSLPTSRAPPQPFGARVHSCLPMVIARFRARGASTPPPCPLPSGGGWPRARPRALCARHVAARASRHARPYAVAASALRLGRNHTAAPLARSAFLLAYGILRLSATDALRPSNGSGCLIPRLNLSRRLLRRLGAAGDTEDHRRRKGHRVLAFSGGCRPTNFNKI